MTSDSEEREVQVTMGLTMRLSQSEEVIVRQIPFGQNPVVVIEPISETEDSARLEVDATGFDTQEELADMLEMIANGLRIGGVKEQ